MPEESRALIQALKQELDYRAEHYEKTEREAGTQYGLARAITILERETQR